jgi:hypothetical protein
VGPSDDNELNALRAQLKTYVLRELLKEDAVGLEEIKALLREELAQLRADMKAEVKKELGGVRDSIKQLSRGKRGREEQAEEPAERGGHGLAIAEGRRDFNDGAKRRATIGKTVVAGLIVVFVVAGVWIGMQIIQPSGETAQRASAPVQTQGIPVDPVETGWTRVIDGLEQQDGGERIQARLCDAEECSLSAIYRRDAMTRTLALQATIEQLAAEFSCAGPPGAVDGDLGDRTVARVRSTLECVSNSNTDPRCVENACVPPVTLANVLRDNESEWLNTTLTWAAQLLGTEP